MPAVGVGGHIISDSSMPFLAILGALLIVSVLFDAFEAMVLPRRLTRKLRVTRLVYWSTWPFWSFFPRRRPPSAFRENFLSWYGPLSMIFMLAVWAAGLVVGFALLYWTVGPPALSDSTKAGFWVCLYMSGTTFFTLGFGDVVPHQAMARALTVTQAGIGFGFLGAVIGYLPVIYAAFSKRETNISMLDGRAGSPPSATEILARFSRANSLDRIHVLLANWEFASAQMQETHISYPVLMYYRSHHDNQSWVASITAVADTCALILVGIEGIDRWQAQLTFTMLRHTLVDLVAVANQVPAADYDDRLPKQELDALRDYLDEAGVHCSRSPEADEQLRQLRAMYEPYLSSLSAYLVLPVTPWNNAGMIHDNWKYSPGVSS
jgi:hypothetical protein